MPVIQSKVSGLSVGVASAFIVISAIAVVTVGVTLYLFKKVVKQGEKKTCQGPRSKQ
jgi:hypothetical protein